jgi:predicted ATPase
MATCEEHGLTLLSAIVIGMRGVAMIERGRYEEGIAQVQNRLAETLAAGARIGRTDNLNILAGALGELDRFDDGLSALAESLFLADRNGERIAEAEIYRIKGELLLRQNESDAVEAETCFREAIEIARNQNAKSYELRATMSLARLLKQQGRRDEARAMLADIYNWFTEGFDTADLKDAKALLDELNVKPVRVNEKR